MRVSINWGSRSLTLGIVMTSPYARALSGNHVLSWGNHRLSEGNRMGRYYGCSSKRDESEIQPMNQYKTQK